MDPISIELRLHASLRKWRDPPIAVLSLGKPCRIGEFLRDAGIPEGEVAIIILNGKRALPESSLSDGDRLSLFPLMGGG
jgi:sulfur carrier protein ThiS